MPQHLPPKYISGKDLLFGQPLKVIVRIIDKVFEKGRQYAADFKQNMAIQFDELLPKWNYTTVPQAD